MFVDSGTCLYKSPTSQSRRWRRRRVFFFIFLNHFHVIVRKTKVDTVWVGTRPYPAEYVPGSLGPPRLTLTAQHTFCLFPTARTSILHTKHTGLKRCSRQYVECTKFRVKKSHSFDAPESTHSKWMRPWFTREFIRSILHISRQPGARDSVW